MGQMLAVRYDDQAAQARVYRNVNGALTPFGNAFSPTGGMTAEDAANSKCNLAIQWGDSFYAAVGRSIHKYDPSTSNWVTTGGVADRNSTTVYRNSGLWVGKNSSGVLRLFSIESIAGDLYRAHYLDIGGSWTTGSAGPATSAGQSSRWVSRGVMFRNQLHFVQGGEVVTYDVATDAFTVHDVTSSATNLGCAFVRAKGQFFMARLSTNSASAYVDLYEYSSGTWSLVVDGSASSPTLPRTTAATEPDHSSNWLVAYYDETTADIILHAYEDRGAGARGWRCFGIDVATLAVTDLTSTVVPAHAYPTGDDISSGFDVHWSVETDNETNPASPVTYVWLLINDGTWERYRWNGAGSAMTVLGTGGDRGVALSHFPQGAGEYVYDGSTTSDPAYHVEEVQDRVAIPGGVRVFLRGYVFDETGGSPTIPDVNVALYYATEEQAGKNLATLTACAKVSGAGSSPVLSSSRITQFTLDGSTIYSADWDAVGSTEVLNGQFHILVPRIEP